MAKIDNFKLFVKNNPNLITYVKNNTMSWQKFYELYDLYGEDDEIWKKYIKDDISDQISIKGLLNTLKNINIDSLEENISSIQKAVGLVEELTRETKKEEEKTNPKEEKIDKLYGEE